MIEIRNRLFISLGLILGFLIFGTVGFLLTEDTVTNVFDSIYFTVVTMTTVGYGDLVPTSGASRVVASIVMIGGIASVLWAIQSVFDLAVSRGIREELGLPEKKTKLKGHYIIVGYGNVGKQTVSQLRAKNEKFIVIENDPAKIEAAVGVNIPIIEGDASEDSVLQRANIADAKGIVTTLTDAMNVIVVISAKMLNPDIQAVTKVEEYRNVAKLKKAGADEIVDCTEMGARVIVIKVRNVAIDPVCGEEVSIRDTPYVHEHGGETYYFHSAECMEKFIEDPKRYIIMKKALEATCGLDLLK
ncbi:MAG TPA: NAD-binding protein [Methanomassiliicoccales archaeon]|nr:NAD-binding protein [Methanomassiliicoccales archaeon]